MNTNDEILISILARTDGLLRPHRDPSVSGWGEICIRRQGWPVCGTAWQGGGDAAERKQAGRAARDFMTAGLVELCRRRGDRAMGAKLTAETEERTRVLCGLPGMAQALERVLNLAKIETEVGTLNGWTPEILLAGVRWGSAGSGPIFGGIELDLLPAFAREWVEFRPTVQGHGWYRLLEAGRQAAATTTAPTTAAADTFDEAAADLYGDEYHKARAELDALPSGGEIGDCPMPVAGMTADYAAKCEAFLCRQ